MHRRAMPMVSVGWIASNPETGENESALWASLLQKPPCHGLAPVANMRKQRQRNLSAEQD